MFFYMIGFFFLKVYLKCNDEETANTLHPYVDLIAHLSSSQAINILVNHDPPVGCAMLTLSAKCETHLMLKVR